MVDDVTLNSGSGGATLAADDIGGVHHQRVKIEYGVDGAATDVSDTNPLPVDDAGGSLTVDGTVTANLSATDNAVLDAIQAAVEIIDNVVFTDDTSTHATGSTQGMGVMAAATPTDASVEANDIGMVAMSTDRRLHVDAQIVGTDAALDVSAATVTVDGSGVTQPVSGTVTANLGATDNAVLDQIDANTDYGAVVGGGAEATALRVTLASDSTGVVSVDDNGAALTVDNAGTFATQVDGDALTALQLIDDVVHVDDTATHATGSTKGALIMGAATPTDTVVDANDIGAVAMSTDRRLHVDAQIVGTDAALDVSAATVTVDGSGVTQPVSGTVTANLSATDNTVLDNIQTAVELIDDAIYVDDADWTDSTSKHMLVGGLYQSAPQTVTDGDVAPFNINSNGAVHVSIQEDSAGIGGGTQYTEDDAAAANPVGNAQILIRADTPAAVASADGDNVAQRATNYGAAYCQILDSSGNFINTFGGSGGTATADDGAFTAGTDQGTPIMGFATSDVVDSGDVGVLAMDTSRNLKTSLEVDNSGILTAVQLIDNPIFVDDAAFTLASSSVNVSGAIRDNVIVDAVSAAAGDAVPLRVNDQGAVWTAPAHIDSTDDILRDEDTDETKTQVTASACVVYGVICTNLDATPIYLHFYNVASASVTVGTTGEEITICVPSSGDANGAAGVFTFPVPVYFDTACTIAATTTIGGTTGPGANEVITDVFWRTI